MKKTLYTFLGWNFLLFVAGLSDIVFYRDLTSAEAMAISWTQPALVSVTSFLILLSIYYGMHQLIEQYRTVHFKIRLAKSAVVSEGLGLADNDVWDKIIAVLCVSDIHAVCTPFIGSLCGKLLTGTNTPFAMSSARMAAFLASISAFFRFLILSSYRFCAPLAFRFK